ncbi:hypothetical protein F3Y22_tig00110483pilonHSYRG00405 [Hibiscus syriacus]|uniref:U-box domain-containing protein n=1 Tax=Hibiscus syriacus TaxID=106335 RepID=A0A6A3AF87_HIBSY|nr:hypothetical protein F3Y22_tig00110483pilonHSYRG00405 [Hibiscus syriacus]
MKDPVTVPTGITYDRESIEKWLFSGKNTACPATKQTISDCELVPNHTLRRLIQSWCTLNACHGIERIPTPKPPISKDQIKKLLDDAMSPLQLMKCLVRLRLIASENDTNKRCIESSGAVEFLASIVSKYDSTVADEALNTLYNLQLSEAALKNLMGRNGDFIGSVTRVMQRGSYECRTYAVFMLKSMLEIANPMQLISLRQELFAELVRVLCDKVSQRATKATLKLLVTICPWGKKQDQGCQSRQVGAAKSQSRARGRFEEDTSSISGRKPEGSEDPVSISKFCGTCDVVQEMVQLGIVAKLCLVVQVECGHKTKEKAREVLNCMAKYG